MKMQNPEILSIGDRVQPGIYPVHSRFNRVINFTDGIRIVALVTPDVGPGPDAIVVNFLEGLQADLLKISSHHLEIDGHFYPIMPDRIYDSSLPDEEWSTPIPDVNIPALETALRSAAPAESLVVLLDDAIPKEIRGFQAALLARFMEGKTALLQGDLPGCAAIVKGLGSGLTPAGDDFVAGILWALHLMEKITGTDFSPIRKEIFKVSRSENLIAQSFLESASEGRFTPTGRAILTAVAAGIPDDVTRATRALMTIGATSGADSAMGLLMALKVLN